MTPRPVVLFAPSLRSVGGLEAFTHLVDQVVPWSRVTEAVCSREVAAVLAQTGLPVREVDGLREGRRALRSAPDRAIVLAVQNPVLTDRGVDLVTIVQNHAALHPWVASAAARSWSERMRYPVLAVLTLLQLRRSRLWYSLNRRVPWLARRSGSWAGSLSNRDLEVVPPTPRPDASADGPRRVVWLGSWWGFRRPLLALDAFALAATRADRPIALDLVAASGDVRVRTAVDERVAQLRQRGLTIEVTHDLPHDEVLGRLAACDAAMFTSAVEGSPVSFVEACSLAPAVIAPDLADYSESIPRRASAEVRLVGATTEALATELVEVLR